MTGACLRCHTNTVVTEPGRLCFRCRPPSAEEHARTWLPENYFLKLSTFDVGILWGLLGARVAESGGVVPAGVMRLLGKLDEITNAIYGESGDTESAGGSSEDDIPPAFRKDAGGSSEPKGGGQ